MESLKSSMKAELITPLVSSLGLAWRGARGRAWDGNRGISHLSKAFCKKKTSLSNADTSPPFGMKRTRHRTPSKCQISLGGGGENITYPSTYTHSQCTFSMHFNEKLSIFITLWSLQAWMHRVPTQSSSALPKPTYSNVNILHNVCFF